MNIGESLTLNALKNPRKTAIIFKEKKINYEDFNARVNKFSNALLSYGVKKGDKISLLMRNCPEYMEAIFASAKIGAVASAVGHLLLEREIEYIVNDAQSSVLILGAEFIDKVENIRAKLKKVQCFIVVGRYDSNEKYLEYEKFVNNSKSTNPECQINWADTFMLDYTSGTTGFPKGALISHRSRILVFLFQAIEYGTGRDDINLTVGNLCHGGPRHHALLQLYLGGTLVLMDKFDPIDVLSQIDIHNVTNFFMVPAMFNDICKIPEAKFKTYKTQSVKTISSGGAPLPTIVKENLLKFFPNAGLNEFYGITEGGIISNLRPIDQVRKLNCVGQSYNHVHVKLIDENDEEVSFDEEGEIYVKSPMLFDGYYNKQDQTDAVMKQGYYATGDIGKFDSEQYLYIVGRKKDMFISGGVNVYPAEIEELLNDHPKISEVAVIGVPDEKWGEVGKAFIVCKRGETLSENEVIDFCKDKTAKMKIPKYISFLKEFPKNEAGKIMKRKLV